MKLAIVGAGIGGLTLALELHDAGIDCEIYEAAPQLRSIGVGINESDTSLRFIQAGDFDCMLLAGRYTLLEQGGLEAFLPECIKRNVSVILGGPYNSGILTGGVKPGGRACATGRIGWRRGCGASSTD